MTDQAHLIRLNGPWEIKAEPSLESNPIKFKFDREYTVSKLYELAGLDPSCDRFLNLQRKFNWPQLSELQHNVVQLRSESQIQNLSIHLNGATISLDSEINSHLAATNLLEISIHLVAAKSQDEEVLSPMSLAIYPRLSDGNS